MAPDTLHSIDTEPWDLPGDQPHIHIFWDYGLPSINRELLDVLDSNLSRDLSLIVAAHVYKLTQYSQPSPSREPRITSRAMLHSPKKKNKTTSATPREGYSSNI